MSYNFHTSQVDYNEMVYLYQTALKEWVKRGYFLKRNLLASQNDYDEDECHDYYEYSGLDLTVYNKTDYAFEMQYDEARKTFNFQMLDYDIVSGENLLSIDVYIDRKTKKCEFGYKNLCTDKLITTKGYDLDVTEEQYFQNTLVEDNIFTFDELQCIFSYAKVYYEHMHDVFAEELKELI